MHNNENWSINMFRALVTQDESSDSETTNDLKEDILAYNSVLVMNLFKGKLQVNLDPNDAIFSLSESKSKSEWEHAEMQICYICTSLL